MTQAYFILLLFLLLAVMTFIKVKWDITFDDPIPKKSVIVDKNILCEVTQEALEKREKLREDNNRDRPIRDRDVNLNNILETAGLEFTKLLTKILKIFL